MRILVEKSSHFDQWAGNLWIKARFTQQSGGWRTSIGSSETVQETSCSQWNLPWKEPIHLHKKKLDSQRMNLTYICVADNMVNRRCHHTEVYKKNQSWLKYIIPFHFVPSLQSHYFNFLTMVVVCKIMNQLNKYRGCFTLSNLFHFITNKSRAFLWNILDASGYRLCWYLF